MNKIFNDLVYDILPNVYYWPGSIHNSQKYYKYVF